MNIAFRNLHARIKDTHILRGIDLELEGDKVHALMGVNGSGKSTLANVVMGNPAYEASGEILVDDRDIMELDPNERAMEGIFLAFQYPVEIPGITVGRFLKRAHDTLYPGDKERRKGFVKQLRASMDLLELDQKFINRYLNEGFSGGEKKRMEILQMLILQPRFAVLDETDSGLDIDALKIVARGVNQLRAQTSCGALIITHYQRILNYIQPDYVHIMHEGRIVLSGGAELAKRLEEKGYEWIKTRNGEVSDD